MNWPAVQHELIRLGGGLDETTPTLSLPAGFVRNAMNFECSTTGGYKRIDGYERYDGRPKPSDAVYAVLEVTGSTTPAVGSTVTGATSGATGVLIAQSANQFILTKKTGTYTSGETLNVSGSPVGTYGGSGDTTTRLQQATYQYQAAEEYRGDIGQPTGNGPIRGVFVVDDEVFCFRNNAGGTGCDLWKATTSGWTQISYGYEVSFTTGTAVINDGDTVTGATSGATGVAKRVMRQSGAWTGTAAGRLIFLSITGTFQNGENLQVSAATKAVCGGAQSAITVAAGGHYDIVIDNFYGGAATRAYGCGGQTRGFEFDGETYAPITTGTTPDTPNHVAVLKNHLVWSIGTSLVHSAPGEPYDYTSASGATEIAIGNTCTGMVVQPGQQSAAALAVFTPLNTQVLYGTGVSDWNLTQFNTGAGATDWTSQHMSQTYLFNQLGVIGIAASQNYGNFVDAALTRHIETYLSTRKDKVACTVISRNKSQYRVFFNEGSGLHITVLNGKFIGAMPIYFPLEGAGQSGIFCAWESQLSDGSEIILYGGADGYVYEADKGTSFDGENIFGTFTLTYDHIRSPRVRKRYRKAALEVFGDGYAAFEVGYQLGYNSTEIQQSTAREYEQGGGYAYWDAFTWDSFFWDSTAYAPLETDVTGTAENIAIVVNHDSAINNSFTINSVAIHYTPRRGMR